MCSFPLGRDNRCHIVTVPRPSDQSAYDRRVTSQLFGRDGELAELVQWIAAAAAGAGSVVTIEGEAGIGKSALLDALAERAAADQGALVLRGRSWEEGGAPPYWPWREVSAAGGWAIGWAHHGDPFSLYAEVVSAARHAARVAPGPLVIIVDDLHAADDDTLRLTRFVARSIAAEPIAMILAARPSDRLLAITRLGAQVSLGPLTALDAYRVIDAATAGGSQVLDRSRRERVQTAAEGNPLFLRELARSAATGRPVPADLVAVVAPAIESVAPVDREVIDLAAVFGREFAPDRLAAATGRTMAAVLAALEPLRAAGIISLAGAPLRGLFSHQLVRDVLYDRLPLAKRLELHGGAAAAIGDSSPLERARHLLAAVPWVDASLAATAARDAARLARANLALADAAALLRAVVALYPDGNAPVDVLVELGVVLRDSGAVTAASEVFDRALVVGRRQSSPLFGQIVLERTQLVAFGADATALLPLVNEALGLLSPEHPVGAVLRARLLARRAALRGTTTDLDAALTDGRAALSAARSLHEDGSGRFEALADALAALHRCCWRPDELRESVEIGREFESVAQRMADTSEELADVDRLAEAIMARLIDELRLGDIAAAEAALGRYAALANRRGRPRHEFFLLSRRAMFAFLRGRLAEGEQLIERAHELGQRIEEPDAIQVFHGARMVVVDQLQSSAETLASAEVAESLALAFDPRLNVHTAHAFVRAGDLQRAAIALGRLRTTFDQLSLARLPLYDLCLVAEVAAALADRDLAAELAQTLEPYRGLAVVNSGAVTFGGVVDHYLGLLAAARGEAGLGRARLADAVDRYRQMGATWWVERAEADLARLGAPPARAVEETSARPAVFRRRGDVWEIGFANSATSMRDARGLAHLHVLLSAPGREIAATDLVGSQASELASREAHHALLDGRAKAAYRQRVRDLQQELDEAEAASDIERAAGLRAELDLLLDELRRAVGLGGRDRVAPSVVERARVTVRKAIAASIERIASHDPHLGYVLRTGVQTGHRCSYQPNPADPIEWELT